MKRCSSCKIKFNTDEELCPLCQNKLLGDKSESVFPGNIRFKTNRIILKILLFITFAISILSGFIELYLSGKLKFTIFIIGGLLTNLFITNFILKNRQNVLKLFEKQGLVLVVVTLLWYFFTKETIITNYIVPSLCFFELLFNLITFIVLKNNYIVNYLSLTLMNIILLILPMLLVALGCTTHNLLSYLCFVFALIEIIGLVLFYFDNLKEEIQKIFNI